MLVFFAHVLEYHFAVILCIEVHGSNFVRKIDVTRAKISIPTDTIALLFRKQVCKRKVGVAVGINADVIL